MDTYIDLCQSFGVPLWVGPLLHAASRLKKTDRIKRRKVYRLIQRQLLNRIGCSSRDKCTYVYPAELKEMVRAAFPNDICDYEDPCHENVVAITMDDLKRMKLS
ncbi:hypothetical protein G5714_014040 [Onychostoma macrolepis]|uniref:Uncharacterized protein n=1 Tax=Onychostoma macrolepis TaxID=369639 RepID=A0A7J6CBL9_9TELE|nr:hypothetical protein G5714_014040 [Onychostoma macrolepis]